MPMPRPTYGSVTATIALFAALGGTSYAAITISGADIRNGTVTGADVRNNSVKSRDVGNGTVTGRDLKNGSVTSSDIKAASLGAADFKPGELPAGPAGPAGPQGVPGPGGLAEVVSRRVDLTVPDGATAAATATCAAGEVAVGGGAGYSGGDDATLAILFDEPLEADGSPPEEGEPAAQWRAFARNVAGGAGAQVMTVHALCKKP